MYKWYKIRLFPTPEQEELMWKHVHACRFVWNYMLDLQNARYKNGRKYLSGFDMCGDLKYMKMQPEMEWLKEVSNASMQKVCRNLHDAYVCFFNNTKKMPKHKSKKELCASFPVRAEQTATYFVNKNTIKLPNIGKMRCYCGYKINPIEIKLFNPQIQYITASKKWILTFSMECDSQAQEITDESMGIDLGVKDLAVVVIGDKKLVFHNINKSKRMRTLEKKKKHIKRAISRKYRTFNSINTPQKGHTWGKSKNIEKYEQILREIEAKMANIRKNYIHKITRQLVNMLPECVVMEDLNIQGLLKNKHLAKSISEQNFYFFIQTMKYKCEEYGIKFIQVNRFYPSSKTCSDCGYVNKNLKLKDRIYKCPNCGLEIDRDYNAAINLMNYTETQYNS